MAWRRRVGDLIGGNYILGEVIGAGGMGVIYDATQWSLMRRVALKVPRPDAGSHETIHDRFRTEALVGSRLRHPNLVAVIDFGVHEGEPFLVMEHVPGRSLGALVRSHGPLELASIMEIAEHVLAALGAAHVEGVVHGDVKCDNVLIEVTRTGATHARLIDFGSACLDGQRWFRDNATLVSGTPEYLAPEVIHGAAPSVATDIYAFGVMLYQLLTGSTPFAGGTVEDILHRHTRESAVPPSHRYPDRYIPPLIEAVVMRALAKDPGERFADAAACAEALRAVGPIPRASEVESSELPTEIVFSSHSPTLEYRGVPTALTSEHDLRQAVERAIERNDPDAIVVAYLELARSLIGDHRSMSAARELEQCLALVEPSRSRCAWRVSLLLAALGAGPVDEIRSQRSEPSAFASRPTPSWICAIEHA